METISFYRQTMASTYATRKFFQKVTMDLQTQLKEWDAEVCVEVEKWRQYVVKVTFENRLYRMSLSKNEIELYQHESPFALDRLILDTLIKQGLTLKQPTGNYLDAVYA